MNEEPFPYVSTSPSHSRALTSPGWTLLSTRIPLVRGLCFPLGAQTGVPGPHGQEPQRLKRRQKHAQT